MDQDAKVERLLEMLRRAAEQLPEETAKDAKRILSKDSFIQELKKNASSKEEGIAADCEWIVQAMDNLIWGRQIASGKKQQIYEIFNVLLSEMEGIYHISVRRPMEPEPESKQEESKLIRLVKELHGPDGFGCKNKDLITDLDVKKKMMYNYRQRLNGAPDQEPWMLGNQRVRTKVETRYEGHEMYVYTPDTLHPVVLQLNMTQAAFLMKALGRACDSDFLGKEIAENIAGEIWHQMSPYGKKQIRKQFIEESRITKCTGYQESSEVDEAEKFGKFLLRLEQQYDDPVEGFEREAEQLKRFEYQEIKNHDNSLNVMYALKSGDGMEHSYTILCKDQSVFRHCRFYLDRAERPGTLRIVDEKMFERQHGDSNKIMDRHWGKLIEIEDIQKIEIDKW